MTSRWVEEAEAVAADLRRRAGVCGRIPPSAVARALGFEVRRKELADGLAGYHLEGTDRIVVAKCWHPPREECSIAHELVEAVVQRTLPDAEHEAFCERAAAALMLPASEYLQTLFARGLDLARMRRREWPWASWEVLARRASDLLPGVVSAAWVDDGVKWRSSSGAPTSAEKAALRDARRKGRGTVLSAGRVASAWSLAPKGATFRGVSLCLPVGRCC